MKYIIVSGIDGSGKTTIIENLIKDLTNKGFKVQCFWMRYHHYFAKMLNAFARVVGLSKQYNSSEGKVWRHEYYKSSFFLSIYIFFTFIDTIIGRIRLNIKKSVDSDYIICDRWVNDVLIDLGTDSKDVNFLESKYYSRYRKVLPSNKFEFVIKRDKTKLKECRLENIEDPYFDIRLKLYENLMKKEDIVVVNNDSTINNAIEFIIEIMENGKS